MKALDRVRKHLVPGLTYRRSDLVAFTTNVDRHLKALLTDGSLKKLSHGLYVVPKNTTFGEVPPNENSLLQSFLNDKHFVVYNPSQFNALGFGSTQLYNTRIVFNRKRTGELVVGGRNYTFRRWREAPKNLTKEFLLVEFLNHLSKLAEDHNLILKNLRSKLGDIDSRKLNLAVNRFGTVSTQKKLRSLLKDKPVRV